MLVLHDTPVTDSTVIELVDNGTFLTESSWSVLTLPSTVLTNSVPLGNVTSTWGPKRDPLYIVVPITVLYAVILLSGLLGNVSTCVVIARNKHMHTATNYYLFSLAVSDLLLLVSGLPQEMYYNWSRYPYVFGEAFCVLQGFAAETSANATVLTITAFTVERYVAICHPFQSHTLSKLSRAVRLILVIWLLAMGLAVPQALQFGVVYEHLSDGRVLDDEHTVCSVKRIVIPHSFEVSSLVFFVAPMTLISVLYALIGLQLRRSSPRGGGGGSVRLKTGVGGLSPQHKAENGRKNFSKNAQIKATKHVVKMLVAVVVAFFICWAPFHAQRLLAVYGAGSHDERPSASMIIVYHTLTYTSGVLYYLSTTVNPVLYHIMSHKFREAFKDTLARYLGRRRARGGRWQCYTVLSGRHSNTSNASNCGTGSLRRYLEADMARLHASRRPIVVSFRRHHTQQQDSTADTELSGGSTSTGPEVYVSLEELTKNNSRFNSRNSSKLKKTRNKLNETYLSVICRHSKHTSTCVRDKITKEGSEKDDTYSGFTSSSNSSFPYGLNHNNRPDDFLVPSWYSESERNICLPINIDIKIPNESSLVITSTESVINNDTEISGASRQSMNYPKVEDIEIFQEQHLKIQSSFKKRQRNSKHNRHHSKSHKTPSSSSNSIEYYFGESRDRLDARLTGIQNGITNISTNTVDRTSHYTVPRSSTLPSFQTITKDTYTHLSDRDVQAMDLSIHILKHQEPFQTSCEIVVRDQSTDERHKIRLSDISTNKNCTDSDSLGNSTVYRLEAHVKSNITSLKEQEQHLFDVTETPICEASYIPDVTCNINYTFDAQSPLDKEPKNESEMEDTTVRAFPPQIFRSDKNINNERTNEYIRSEKEDQTQVVERLSSVSPEDDNLPLQDDTVVKVEEHNNAHREETVLEEYCDSQVPNTIYEFAVPVQFCTSRPKSCTDLRLPAHVSVRQNCDLLSSTVYSSSPRLATCDLAL